MDKRAVSILFDTYWSSAGWKPEAKRNVSPDDFAYALKHGVMFNPVLLDHSTVVKSLRDALAKVTPQMVGGAFLASLTSRRLDWRSVFGSYVVFRHMEAHAPTDLKRCGYCGLYLDDEAQDLNVLNFERLKWGGVRHESPAYALFDLELFLKEPPPTPTPADVAACKLLLAAIDAAPAGTTSASLHKLFPAELRSNRAEREVIIGMLGFCGALGTKDHPGFGSRFVPSHERALPNRRNVDMAYPACWWEQGEGLNRDSLMPYFGAFADVG